MKLYFYIFKIKTYIFFLKLYIIKYYGRFSKALHNSVNVHIVGQTAGSRKNITRTIGTQTIDSTETGEQRVENERIAPQGEAISLDQSWLAI